MSLSAAKIAELQEKMPLKLQEKITKLPVQSAESHVLCPLSRQTDALYIAATVSQKETVSNRLE